MGSALSQEQIESHLQRQEMLLKQLQAVVDRQTEQLRAVGRHDTYDPNNEKVAPSTGTKHIADEIEGLARAAKHAEKKKAVDVAISEEEAKKPSIEWKEPTEEEERNFMATKPWLGAMAMPDGFQFGKTDGLPDVKLELEYVYGYRARTCRNNIAWLGDGENIIYPAAATGVVHNTVSNKQYFQRDHTDDIVCLAYHAGRKIVATGQQGKTPSLIIWDATTGGKLAILKGFHERAVISVAFSADGSKVASVGLDDNHSVAIYDWSNGSLLGTSKGDTNRILDIQNNTTKDVDPNASWVSVGVKHIKFWTIKPNGLDQQKGLLGTKGEQKGFLTVTSTTLYTCVGTSDGEIYLFEREKLMIVVDAHQRHVFALKSIGDVVYSGGKDGFISMWNMNNQKKLGTVNLNKFETPEVMSSATNAVRAIDVAADGRVLVGTITSNIYVVNVSSNMVNQVVTGHFGNLKGEEESGELWGCATSPVDGLIGTAGEDATLRLWNVESRSQVARFQLKDKCVSVAWANTNDIACGLANGTVQIVTYNPRTKELDESVSIKKRTKRIQCLQYSPDSSILAAGNAENTVDLYDAKQGYKLLGSCKGNNTVILHVDFSKSGKYLQTCSQSYELLFYDVSTANQYAKSRELRNEQWDTFSSILGWDVQGIWPPESDGSDVNAVNKSHSGKYLATAEDTGFVRLFNYPCVGGGLDKAGKLVRRPQSQSGAGHSSHVTNVAWTSNDTRVVSTGGADLCVFQWKVVKA